MGSKVTCITNHNVHARTMQIITMQNPTVTLDDDIYLQGLTVVGKPPSLSDVSLKVHAQAKYHYSK